ncbi:Molybdopterin converting factor subunit 2 [Phaffia rhodozyma]|uniref:Molybdopterin converting factor subunit 2 n=1 Tax=Phaffia rhodozyma TaxID=264483 RepID=A0A0F7SSW0_PHARH|nr:Molybdopterin converting factor subunit 2 [Phaffia rhodozyma]
MASPSSPPRQRVSLPPSSMEASIRVKLEDILKPIHLSIRNDSSKHSHHQPMKVPGAYTGETHFFIHAVSAEFNGKTRIARHRLVNNALVGAASMDSDGKVVPNLSSVMYNTSISHSINERNLIESVKSSKAGAVCTFIGTTRDNFEDKLVSHLSYTTYAPLALKTLLSILSEVHSVPCPSLYGNSHELSPGPSAKIHRISVAHRLRAVPMGETSIVIAVSSSHRREGFDVCEWVLEQIKRRVQIWKKEVYVNGQTLDEALSTPLLSSVPSSEPPSLSVWKENFPEGRWE